jgi:hypothetical protein
MSLEEKLQPPYNHWLPLVRFYWHHVMMGIVQQVEADKKKLILDFGCGKQRLKHYLPRHDIIGYDIIKEYSDIIDYKILQPHTIVCSHVLEHLEPPQFLEAIYNFKNVLKPMYLITAQPTENWLSKISNLISRPRCLKSDFRVLDHKLSIKEIHGTLSKYYKLKARSNIFTLTIISKWAQK